MRWRRRYTGPGRGLQLLRRTVQVSVLLMLILIPVLSLYDNLRNQRDEIGIEARWDTAALHRVVGGLEEPKKFTQAVRGSVWTLKVGRFVVSDPLAVVDFFSASRALFDPFLLTTLIPVLLTVLLGRVFCGWICPADLLFEVGAWVRDLVGIRTDVTFSRRTKYAVLLIGIVAGAAFGSQVFAEIYPPRILGGELYLWITFGAFGAGAWLFLAIVTFELFVSRRFWCRYMCPGGALYSLLGRFRVVRLKVVDDACTSCSLCNSACEFGLQPMAGKMGQECNNCGLCVRACGHDALVWRVGPPPRGGLDILPSASSGEAPDRAA